MFKTLMYTLFVLKLFTKENSNRKNIKLGSVTVKQLLSGRIRLYSEKLKNTNLKKALDEQLLKIEFIKDLNIDVRTGSLLIVYDNKKIDEKLLFASLIRLIDGEINNEKTDSILTQEIKTIGKSINQAILDKTHNILDLKASFVIILTIFAINQYSKNKSLGSPSAFTLLMWAYNQIKESK